MVQGDLELFTAAVDGGDSIVAPMSASETAKAAELHGGDRLDRKGTAAYRACLVYNRQLLAFFSSPEQQRRTQALRKAGTLHNNDARYRIPLLLKDVAVGREMEMLSTDDFFFLVGTYMNNNRRVRTNMQGNTKRNHMNDVMRVFRKFLKETPGRKEEADFKWKSRMSETWKIMQSDTLKRAEAGIEKARSSADPFTRRQLVSNSKSAHAGADVRLVQSNHLCTTALYDGHRGGQSIHDKICHYNPHPNPHSKDRPMWKFHATYAKKAHRIEGDGGVRSTAPCFVSEFNYGTASEPTELPVFATAHARLCDPTHRPVGPYCEVAAFDLPAGEKRKSKSSDQSRQLGGLYLKPKRRGAHFSKSGVLFFPRALSDSALQKATKILRSNLELQDPEEHEICWANTQHKKYTQHSYRATFRVLLRLAGVPEHFIDLAGGWASKSGAGAEYGHETGVCPEEVLMKISAILGGWRLHYDDMVMQTDALLVNKAQMEEQRAFLIAELQEEKKKSQLQLQNQPTAGPLPPPTPPQLPTPAAAALDLTPLTRIESQLHRDFPVALAVLGEVAVTTARLSRAVASLQADQPPPLAPPPPPTPPGPDHTAEMREMRLALSNNTKQVARLVASMSKVSTDLSSTLASKDAQLASLSAHLADLRVSSASDPAPSPAATPAYGAAYVAAASHLARQPDLQIKGRRAPDPLTTPAE